MDETFVKTLQKITYSSKKIICDHYPKIFFSKTGLSGLGIEIKELCNYQRSSFKTHPMHPGSARRTFLEHSHLQRKRQRRHLTSRLHEPRKRHDSLGASSESTASPWPVGKHVGKNPEKKQPLLSLTIWVFVRWPKCRRHTSNCLAHISVCVIAASLVLVLLQLVSCFPRYRASFHLLSFFVNHTRRNVR